MPDTANVTDQYSSTNDMGTGYTASYEGTKVIALDIQTTLIDLGAGLRWNIHPKFGLDGGILYSHVLSSTYTGRMSTTVTITEIDNGNHFTNSDRNTDKIKGGDLENIEKNLADSTEHDHVDGFKCKPQDFISLRLTADYEVTPGLSVSIGYVLPMADHLVGKTLNGSIHRAVGGIRWTFGSL